MHIASMILAALIAGVLLFGHTVKNGMAAAISGVRYTDSNGGVLRYSATLKLENTKAPRSYIITGIDVFQGTIDKPTIVGYCPIPGGFTVANGALAIKSYVLGSVQVPIEIFVSEYTATVDEERYLIPVQFAIGLNDLQDNKNAVVIGTGFLPLPSNGNA